MHEKQKIGTIPYLLQESVLFLTFAYLIFIGATLDTNIVIGQIDWILGGIAGLAWFIWRTKNHRPFPATPIDLPLGAWLAALGISVVFSSNPRLSLEYFNMQLVYVLVFYLVVDLVRAGWAENLWIKTMVLSSIFSVALGIFTIAKWYYDWFQIGGWEQPIPPATLRVSSTHLHPNLFAAFLNLLVALSLAWFLKTSKKGAKILLGLWMAGLLGSIFFTSSRGGWLGTAGLFAAASILLLWDQKSRVRDSWQRLRKRPLFLAGILAAGAAMAVLVGFLLIRQANHPSHPTSRDPRSYIWKVALDMFQNSPLVGEGPGTFGLSYLRHYSIPPGMLLAHAHNYFLSTLAESGILGALALVFLAGSLVPAIWRLLKSLPSEERGTLIGMTAGLAGLAVHSLFDTPQVLTINSLVTAVIIGLVMAKYPSAKNQAGAGRKILPGLLWLSGTMALLTGGWILFGYQAYNQALIASNENDWARSAAWMDQAVARDPQNRFYQFQEGFVYGMLALNQDGSLRDRTALEKAVTAYERALAFETSNSLHWANLGVLYRAAGNREKAIDAMEAALQLAPESSVFNLNLGRMEEELGLNDQALAMYTKALELKPDWQDRSFFTGGKLWQQAIRDTASSSMVDEGWQAIDQGHFSRAEEIFRARLAVNTADAYRGLGIAWMGQGRIEEGEKALKTAAFIDGVPLQARLQLGRYFLEFGDKEASDIEYSNAVRMIEANGAFNHSDAGNGRYAWEIYRRPGFAPGLLPGWIHNSSPEINLNIP